MSTEKKNQKKKKNHGTLHLHVFRCVFSPYNMIFLHLAHPKLKHHIFGRTTWTANFDYITSPLGSQRSHLGIHDTGIIGLFNLIKQELYFLVNLYIFKHDLQETSGSLGGSASEESACNAGDPGSISRLGRYPGEGNGYPIQYSCLENSMDRATRRATVHGISKSQT